MLREQHQAKLDAAFAPDGRRVAEAANLQLTPRWENSFQPEESSGGDGLGLFGDMMNAIKNAMDEAREDMAESSTLSSMWDTTSSDSE